MKTNTQKLFRLVAVATIILVLGIGSQPAIAQDEAPAYTNYEIFIYDLHTGTTRQLTNLPGSEQYNPSFSPDGKWVVHDAYHPSISYQEIYITDVATGVSRLLPGGDLGNDPAWSPNGKLIAFDKWDGHLYLLPLQGGELVKLADWAGCASWAPNSRRLAFTSWADGKIHTIAADGSDETVLEVYGFCPKWSPNGQWLTYVDWGVDLTTKKIPVSLHGDALGEPISILPADYTWTIARWSVDSQSLVISGPMSGSNDWDILTVASGGGEITRLTGLEYFGDYDPAFSNDGRFVAYAAAIPAP